MSESKTYDLAVIGSGTAAQVASFRVRAAGWSVAVMDHLPFGGSCALRGCDLKKMLVSGAEAIDMDRRMRGRGVTGEIAISRSEPSPSSAPSPIPSRRSSSGNHCCSTEFWPGWGNQTGTVAGSPHARGNRAAGHLPTAPIPKGGPLAEPKSVDQIGFPAELTRQAIPPDPLWLSI